MINIVLHQPENPGNVGNIMRTCAVLGATLHLVRPFGFRLHDPQFKRSVMDYLAHVQWYEYPEWQALQDTIPKHAGVYAFTTKTQTVYSHIAYQSGDYLVFGAESRGLPEGLRHSLTPVTLPMPGSGRSLNLAVSVGIAAYEAARQVSGNWNDGNHSLVR